MADPRPPTRASLLGLAVVVRVLRALGPFRRELSNLVGGIWYLTQTRETRDRAASNFRRLDPSLSPAASFTLARRSYRAYAAMVFDSIWAESMTPAQVLEHMQVRGEARLRIEGGAVVAMPHFGNWDISAGGALALGVPVTTVMGPVVTDFFTSLVTWSRRRKGLELYTPERAARGLVRSLRAGRVVALMADVPEAGPTVTVPFCGGPVRFSAVPARLAQSLGKPLLPLACWRAGSGWIVDVGTPIEVAPDDTETVISARLAEALEVHVRRHPEQWYPFHEVYVDDSSDESH